MGTLRSALSVTLVLALVAGCGGGGGEAGPAGADTGLPPPEQAAGGTFTAEAFEPPFTIELPPGWEAQGDVPGFVQFFAGPNELQALSFASGLADVPPAQVVERLRSLPGFEAGEPRTATVAGREATVVEGVATEDFALEGTEYFGFVDSRVRAYVLPVEGRTVVVFADAPQEQADAFFAQVDQVLETLEFGGAGA